jgi:integrase
VTARGLVFPGKPNAQGERAPIEADVLLPHILRRALRKAGLPELRFHDLRHIGASLMLEAGVSLKRVQQVIGHASETTTLKIYAQSCVRSATTRQIESQCWLGSHHRGTIGKQSTMRNRNKVA